METNNEPIISIKDLRVSYGQHEVLKGINLEVYRGQIIGYIGTNGAGKSTTVKTILGLVPKYSGEIKIFGKDIKESGIEYKKRIGYIPEVPDIYDNLTAKEYLTFMGEIYGLDYDKADQKAQKLMNLFQIEKSYNSRISSFSKGMKQKVLIIASLIHNPDILFLDEPLSGLDANSVMIFKEILAELANQGKTIFYSSHIMDVVEKISTRIVLINNGDIAADGSFNELKEKSKEGSLEQIFNQLTGFNTYNELAEEFVSTIEEV
ncbi:ABC transporter ATP-binding protein [Clostridium hydrogenum]|uniref:ABC transporter ATP-binding protein n=1 Tax=Clostridium hydrogenum TaxID=2855764 RepID=UPI001F1A163F|nr:ABC transporter ATP-binding protein [Clostridium hydrogenum]